MNTEPTRTKSGTTNSANAELAAEQTAAVTMLLSAGKTIRDIAKFAELDAHAVTQVARELDREPDTEAQRRAKELFGSGEGLTYQRVAKQLATEGHTADDGEPMHHLTVASWVRNYGWAWGGAADGEYAPEQPSNSVRSRYVLRLSKSMDAEINSTDALAAAVDAAWNELTSDKTRVVQLAIIRGSAMTGVTNVTAVKKQLMAKHGDEIRNTRE